MQTHKLNPHLTAPFTWNGIQCWSTHTHTHTPSPCTLIGNGLFIFAKRGKKKENEREKSIRFMKRGFYAKSNPKSATIYYTHAPYHGAMRIPPYNSQFVSLLLLRLSQLMGLLRLLLEPNSTDVIVELGSSETPLFAVELRLKELMRGALIEHWTVNEYNHTHTHTCILGFMFTVFRYYLK